MASPADFQVTRGFGGFAENTKINFGKLFLRQIIAGSGTNQSDVIDANTATGLGKTSVNNWEIYDGLSSGAELVAYGQGMHTYAGNWQNWFTMVFEVQRFKGSTLQIMGASLDKSNEWAIVGGTGEFAMARGIIQRTEYKFVGDEKIHELTIEAYCRMTVPTPTSMGPWGLAGGLLYGITGKSQRLESVTIRHSIVVEAISFSYGNEVGQILTAGPWGNPPTLSNDNDITIKFGPLEFVKELSGGNMVSPTYMTGLKIVTNVKTYGPFGTNPIGSNLFNVTVPDDKTVVGFFVHAEKTTMRSIGVYVI